MVIFRVNEGLSLKTNLLYLIYLHCMRAIRNCTFSFVYANKNNLHGYIIIQSYRKWIKLQSNKKQSRRLVLSRVISFVDLFDGYFDKIFTMQNN